MRIIEAPDTIREERKQRRSLLSIWTRKVEASALGAEEPAVFSAGSAQSKGRQLKKIMAGRFTTSRHICLYTKNFRITDAKVVHIFEQKC